MTDKSPFGPDVVAIHGFTRRYFSSANSAAVGILRELYGAHGVVPGRVHARVARYTADGTVGGEITDAVVAVLLDLPPQPVYPKGPITDPTTYRATNAAHTKAMKKWNAESCAVLVKALGLR